MALARTLSLCVLGAFVGMAQMQSSMPTLDGFWVTDGYGQVLEIKGSTLRMYETTAVSCVFSETATSKKRQNLFTSKDGDDDFLIKSGTNHTVLQLNEGGLSDIELHRVPQLPASCNAPPENTPLDNYNIFWETFSEQYPSFARRETDWNATNQRFRSQISESTTPNELFNILRAMIQPLQDTHTGINAASIHKGFGGVPRIFKSSAPSRFSKYVRRQSLITSKEVFMTTAVANFTTALWEIRLDISASTGFKRSVKNHCIQSFSRLLI